MIDNWLRNIRNVYNKHKGLLSAWSDSPKEHLDRLCELNVIEQALNVCETTIVQEAWANGQELNVHGWVYGLNDGLINDLEFNASSPVEVEEQYRVALRKIELLGDMMKKDADEETDAKSARSLWGKLNQLFR
jgi:carbonic anhydrase